MDLKYYKYVLVKLMSKFYDISKLDKYKNKDLHFIIKDNKEKLEQRNIELQQRMFDIKWHIDTVIKMLQEGNNEKALKLLKKVMYND